MLDINDLIMFIFLGVLLCFMIWKDGVSNGFFTCLYKIPHVARFESLWFCMLSNADFPNSHLGLSRQVSGFPKAKYRVALPVDIISVYPTYVMKMMIGYLPGNFGKSVL